MFSNYPLPKSTYVPPQQDISDPTACCLRNSMFTCVDNPDRNQVGKCTEFMAQRCAKSWDGKCDLYLDEKSNEDYTGKAANEFLKKTLESKFCRLDTSNPAAHCFDKGTQFNPLAFGPGKGQMEQQEGDFVYRPTNKMMNISTNNYTYGRLDTASPIKIAKCPKTCDLNILNIANNDRAINECLDRGIAQDVIQNIAENLAAAGAKSSNQRLNDYIDKYVISGIKPGFASLGAANLVSNVNMPTPAVNTYLKPGQSYQLDENIGNFGNSLTPSSTLAPSPRKRAEKFRHQGPTGGRFTGFPAGHQQHFRYIDNKDKTMLSTVVLLVLIAYVMYLYFKH